MLPLARNRLFAPKTRLRTFSFNSSRLHNPILFSSYQKRNFTQSTLLSLFRKNQTQQQQQPPQQQQPQHRNPQQQPPRKQQRQEDFFVVSEGTEKPQEQQNENIKELNEKNFNQFLGQATVPVILECYINSHPQTKQMDSKLEKLVNNSGGVLKLGKIDISSNPQIAQHLEVTEVPTLFVIYQGEIINKLVGVVQDTQLLQFVETCLKIGGYQNAQITASQAEAFLDEGNIPEAAKLYNQMLTNPNLKHEATALAGLARCALAEKKLDVAKSLIETIRKKYPRDLNSKDVIKAISMIDLASADSSSESQDALIKKIEQNPNDLEARYNLGVKYASTGKVEEAISQMLEIIKKDKHWKDEAARNFLVKIFDSLGPDNEIAKRGRRRLSNAWFS